MVTFVEIPATLTPYLGLDLISLIIKMYVIIMSDLDSTNLLNLK